ncbi:TPA: alpha/beta fold hydrolase [Photobacterium damselae]
MTDTSSYPLSQEAQFSQTMQGPVAELWQHRQEGIFHGVDGLRIGWMAMTHTKNDKVIVVVNGRIESYWKYQETIYDLFQQGYDVFSLDHRGQGVSDRLTTIHDLGHIAEFDDYVTDLKTLFDQIITPRGYQQHFMLGHSMGGTISSLFLSRFPNIIDRAAMTAPMHGIYLDNPVMKKISYPLLRLIDSLQTQPQYTFTQKGYMAKPFIDNPYTHSEVRYQWFRDLYQHKPELQIGGPSSRWVWQGMRASQHCIEQATNIQAPLLIIQAGNDRIVDNDKQQQFLAAMQPGKGQLITIDGANHELLFESDIYRNQSLNATLSHFANQSTVSQ